MQARVLLRLLLLLIPAEASAHHSLSLYEMAELRTAGGIVRTIDWSNPHVTINVLVADANGQYYEWEFEGGSVGRLTGSGFKRDAIAPGDWITVSYNPRRDHMFGGFIVAITTANGATYSADRFRGPAGGNAGIP